MKMKTLIGTALALTLGIGSAAYAFNDYYPPERIHCRLANGKLSCNDFNRQYLTEDTYTADFPKSQDITFHFGSAVAYFTPSQEEASVFFTYRDSVNKMVKLRTVNTSIKPDLVKGSWRKFNDEIYLCDAGYMSCPITNLPSNR